MRFSQECKWERASQMHKSRNPSLNKPYHNRAPSLQLSHVEMNRTHSRTSTHTYRLNDRHCSGRTQKEVLNNYHGGPVWRSGGKRIHHHLQLKRREERQRPPYSAEPQSKQSFACCGPLVPNKGPGHPPSPRKLCPNSAPLQEQLSSSQLSMQSDSKIW